VQVSINVVHRVRLSRTDRVMRPAFPSAGGGSRALRLAAVACIALVLVAGSGSVVLAAGGRSASTSRIPATVVIPACVASQLSARIVDWTGAAGSRIADVQLVNTSFARCSLRDFPRVQLVSSHAAVMIDGAAASTTAHTHGFNPLGFLRTEVTDTNYCGPAYSAPVTIAFVLPGTAGRVIAMPLSATDTSGVAPCLGASGSAGHISMHAWHP